MDPGVRTRRNVSGNASRIVVNGGLVSLVTGQFPSRTRFRDICVADSSRFAGRWNVFSRRVGGRHCFHDATTNAGRTSRTGGSGEQHAIIYVRNINRGSDIVGFFHDVFLCLWLSVFGLWFSMAVTGFPYSLSEIIGTRGVSCRINQQIYRNYYNSPTFSFETTFLL